MRHYALLMGYFVCWGGKLEIISEEHGGTRFLGGKMGNQRASRRFARWYVVKFFVTAPKAGRALVPQESCDLLDKL